jgi:hypothetical protein
VTKFLVHNCKKKSQGSVYNLCSDNKEDIQKLSSKKLKVTAFKGKYPAGI